MQSNKLHNLHVQQLSCFIINIKDFGKYYLILLSKDSEKQFVRIQNMRRAITIEVLLQTHLRDLFGIRCDWKAEAEAIKRKECVTLKSTRLLPDFHSIRRL